jgi:hypothetical protein
MNIYLESFDVVNEMSLEEGHTLTEQEALAIDDIFQEVVAFRAIKRALGLIEE